MVAGILHFLPRFFSFCGGGKYAYEHEPNFIFSSLPKLSPATLRLKDKDLDKQQDVMEKPCFQLQNTKQSKHKPKAGLSLKHTHF